ncbi:MAG: helix-turn-helix domain-containing protein [Dehalococcoidales bacterium]|jgi:purine catabolism regulator
MPTLEQVWRAMPRGTDLVTGDFGIYNEVSWVVTLRPTPPGFDRLRGKELALVDAATARGLGITLAYLITSLSEQGASALGILGEGLPAAMEMVNGYKIPVMQLPPESDLTALEGQLTTLIREEKERLYQREQELTKELMELALAGRGIDVILQKLKELTGRTIMLLDLDFAPRSPNGNHKFSDVQSTLTRLFHTAPSSIVGLKLANGFSGFLSPITGKQGAEGYLLIIAPTGEIQEADRVTAKVGALSLAIEISRQQAVEDVEDKFQVEMVESLLNGDLPPAAVNERAERLGLDLSRSYAVMVVQIADVNLKGTVVTRKATALFSKALCHCRTNSLIILYPVAADTAAEDLRRLGQEAAQKLAGYLGAKVSLGIGRAYTGAAGLRTSFQEAERSLAVGKRLFGEGSTSFFGDLGVYRLLLSIGPDELKSFYQDAIGLLAEYDLEHEGELLQTLEATLRYPTLAETAKVLHVHRNTLLYRLQRIQEIASLNLDDGETRLKLHLALRAGEVIRAA